MSFPSPPGLGLQDAAKELWEESKKASNKGRKIWIVGIT